MQRNGSRDRDARKRAVRSDLGIEFRDRVRTGIGQRLGDQESVEYYNSYVRKGSQSINVAIDNRTKGAAL